jgi:Tol biopolymer transport system component
MGDCKRVIAEAETCLRLWPGKSVFQYHTFCALTALGEYDKATALFRQIISPGYDARRRLQEWCMKYVFDTLEAGRSWHPPDREPVGAPFLPMLEADETWHQLSTKAKSVIADGFTANWSPDGVKLAFSLGVHGYSGVAIFDPATKETDLLIVPGKDPVWSPDGRYIAFVRDCQILRLSEFATAERRYQHRLLADEEVWVMKSDGTEPRRLARGGWPSWSQDSKRLYYQSRTDKVLFSIAVDDANTRPIPILACSNNFPSMSPDEKCVAFMEGASLKIKDLAAQTLVAEWPVPFTTWGGAGWSPTGSELCLGGDNTTQERTGLWIYGFDRLQPAKVLAGQIVSASWSPKATGLAFCLGSPHYEIWVAALDPDVSAVEALAPGRTLEEHYQEMVRLYTRAIEADPNDAYAYSDRARYYDYLHDRANANADMRRWSVVMGGGMSSDVQLATPRDFRRVINMPFDCQIVFSVERRDNEIPVLCIAFGQKGRWGMKLFEIPVFVASLFGLGLLSGFETPSYADFTFGPPTNLGPTVNSSSDDGGPSMSPDGCTVYFHSNRAGGYGGWDLYVATRESKDDEWARPVNLGALVNSSYLEGVPCISADGLSLYFNSNRPGGFGSYDLWMTTRATLSDLWGPPANLGPTVNRSSSDLNPNLSSDGLSLYFASSRPGGYGDLDIYMTTRATKNGSWELPVNLGPAVNSPSPDYQPSVSTDGLSLFFASERPGGYGEVDIYMTTRATKNDPWGPPVNLGPPVNGSGANFTPNISGDSRILYFTSTRAGGYGGHDSWQAPIIPIVDFNADGKVDAADMALLVANWGKNQPLCDIGPFPWGDGVVDEKDLRVLVESLVTPGPRASDVPCDVILSWISPSFAKAHDVYLVHRPRSWGRNK